MSAEFQRGWGWIRPLPYLHLFDESTRFDEVDNYFATEADIMIDVESDLDKD